MRKGRPGTRKITDKRREEVEQVLLTGSPPALDGVPPVVLETFGGSGTTMVAAELEGVRCIGIEMEPSYCDIIRARLTDAIGGEDGTTD